MSLVSTTATITTSSKRLPRLGHPAPIALAPTATGMGRTLVQLELQLEVVPAGYMGEPG